jgi:hypothetical protein
MRGVRDLLPSNVFIGSQLKVHSPRSVVIVTSRIERLAVSVRKASPNLRVAKALTSPQAAPGASLRGIASRDDERRTSTHRRRTADTRRMALPHRAARLRPLPARWPISQGDANRACGRSFHQLRTDPKIGLLVLTRPEWLGCFANCSGRRVRDCVLCEGSILPKLEAIYSLGYESAPWGF